VKPSQGFKSAAERLAAILEIARDQRKCIERGDLEAVQELQGRRQELLAGVQPLDRPDGQEKGTVSEILNLDQEMVCLLLSEVVDIQDRMQKTAFLRKLLRTRPRVVRRPAHQLSRHI
jgi:hypothetical protein